MPIRISIQLKDDDLQYFRNIALKARKSLKVKDEGHILAKAEELLTKAKMAETPAFVEQHLQHLALFLQMLRDDDWGLAEQERMDVLAALAYFIEPADLIHDDVPVLGFLDDAIMIELVTRELQHEIDAYQDFVHYRTEVGNLQYDSAQLATREQWLANKRNQLYARMRRRRSRIDKKISRQRLGPKVRLF